MILRRSKQLEGPKWVGQNEYSQHENDEAAEKEVSTSSNEVIGDDTSNESPDGLKKIYAKSYVPNSPFLQRMVKVKLDQQFGKFLDVLKKLHINIPFTNALSQMPSYAKFLKEILSNKKKARSRGVHKRLTGLLVNRKSVNQFFTPLLLAFFY